MSPSKLRAEAERLARKAQDAENPSEQRMLDSHARFYEMIADLDAETARFGDSEKPINEPEPPGGAPMQ
jgi:hypothetical protein